MTTTKNFVLNLIITGIPSIQFGKFFQGVNADASVLNLIITGIPSIHYGIKWKAWKIIVLNLIITGIPSILEQ